MLALKQQTNFNICFTSLTIKNLRCISKTFLGHSFFTGNTTQQNAYCVFLVRLYNFGCVTVPLRSDRWILCSVLLHFFYLTVSSLTISLHCPIAIGISSHISLYPFVFPSFPTFRCRRFPSRRPAAFSWALFSRLLLSFNIKLVYDSEIKEGEHIFQKWLIIFFYLFIYLLKSRLQSHFLAVNCGVFWWWD